MSKEQKNTQQGFCVTPIPHVLIPLVEPQIENYRKDLVCTDAQGGVVRMPYGELHSVASFQALFDAFSELTPFDPAENKEWYVGLYPCVKEEADGSRHLSFYFIPTIGACGLTNPPGVPINPDEIIDYTQAVAGAVKETTLTEIQNNIFDLGNQWP